MHINKAIKPLVGNQIVVPVARFSPPACDPFRLVAGQPKNYSIIVAAAEFPAFPCSPLDVG